MSSETPLAQSFEQLPLSDQLLAVLDEIGYQVPTPVQSGSIPHAIEGRDLMVQSQTGTGKTAAFSIPIIERFSTHEGISALVLAPTRELANQVAEEARRLSAGLDHFEVICVYGGVPIDRQIEAIKQTPRMIVGTPGRVIDHLRRKTLTLNQIRCFVLDEADEMLSMGFAEELEEVLRYLPKNRQTLFFSATFPASVKRYAARVLQDPLFLSFLDESSSADDLEHRYCLVRGVARGRHLVNLIREANPESALVFTNTRRDAERVTQLLNKEGLNACKLSGDMDQGERDRVMKKMKSKKVRLLVATDVAARGIDISQLSHVFHYQLPDNAEVYIHRSGRTGRAGAKGEVISLAGSQDLGVIYALKRFHHLELVEVPLPEAQPRPLRETKRAEAPLAPQVDPSLTAQPREDARLKRRKTQTSPARPLIEADEGPASSQEKPPLPHEDHGRAQASEHKRERRIRRGSTSQSVGQKTSAQDLNVEPQQVIGISGDKPITPDVRRGRRRRPDQAEASRGQEEERASPRPILEVIMGAQGEREIDLPRLRSLTPSERAHLVQAIVNSDQVDVFVDRLVAEILNVYRDNRATGQRGSSPQSEVSLRSKSPPLPQDKRQTRGDEGVWLYVNVGWRDCEEGFSGVRNLIAELGGLLPEDVDQLKVKGQYSLVRVDPSFEDDLIEALNGELFAGKKLKIERATSLR